MQKKLILDSDLLDITLSRLCEQLIENHGSFQNSVILGMQPRGIFLAEQIQKKLSEYDNITYENSDDSIDNMKRLAGINSNSVSDEPSIFDKSNRIKFIQENNIKHGTPRWFKVMYARPELTGEDPYGE